jgi:HAD superfamily hydrolase (TIGR01509 family)
VTIRAVLFDFDGTLWDSETAAFESWREAWAEFGLAFPLEVFAALLGTLGGLDPVAELERRLGRAIDRDDVRSRRWERKLELLDELRPRPGVERWLRDARSMELATAIVSTDDTSWITEGLRKIGLLDGWAFIECAEGDRDRAKPSPALYVSALARLDLAPHEAIAVEDSPNGIRSAKGAGLFCLAVANRVTRQLDLSAADLVIDSLEDLPLHELLTRFEQAEDDARAADRSDVGPEG